MLHACIDASLLRPSGVHPHWDLELGLDFFSIFLGGFLRSYTLPQALLERRQRARSSGQGNNDASMHFKPHGGAPVVCSAVNPLA